MMGQKEIVLPLIRSLKRTARNKALKKQTADFVLSRSLKRTAMDRALMIGQKEIVLPLIRSLKRTAMDKALKKQTAASGLIHCRRLQPTDASTKHCCIFSALSIAVGFSRRTTETQQ